MRLRTRTIAVTLSMGILICLMSFSGSTAAAGDKPAYPPTKAVPVTEELHGVKIIDSYRWLEETSSPEVRAWIEAQNSFTKKALGDPQGRKMITRRLEELYDTTTTGAPDVYGQRYIFSRRKGLQNHPVYYIRKEKHDAAEKVLIDPNTFSKTGTTALDWMYPTDDGLLIAYGKSVGGDEKSTLFIRNSENGEEMPDTIPNTRYCSVAWDKDNNGFYYTRYPEKGTVPEGDENYNSKVFYHKLGNDWKEDVLVFGEGRPKEETRDLSKSSDGQYMFLSASLDWAKNDLYVRKIDAAPTSAFTAIAVRLEGQTRGDVIDESLLLLTNVDAPRYRLVRTPLAKSTKENWVNIIPEGKGVITSFQIVNRDKLLLSVQEDVHSRLMLYDIEGKLIREIKLPTLGTAEVGRANRDGEEMFYEFSSFAFPPTVFRYDFIKNESEKIAQTKVKAKIDEYITEQKWYTSKDGTKVPMFLMYKRGVKLDGSNPTVLYGYGGFDISITPEYRPYFALWLEQGGIYAIANIRGGGEFGKAWHEAGRQEKKQNVFDDFIAAAEYLIKNKYTNPKKLAIRGGSNGGLLVGACAVQRPDLYQAVLCAVPLLDMLRYHNFEIARLWIPEYGSVADEAQFKVLHAYSPYHHVKDGTNYPAVFITTAEGDSRVAPLHALKMAALLQNATGGDRPILLRVETMAGHGVGKPLSKQIEDQTDEWLFLMEQLGMLGKKVDS